jgi:hypothetical protein
MPALRGVAGFIFGVLALGLPGLTLTFLVALYAAQAIISVERAFGRFRCRPVSTSIVPTRASTTAR